MGRFFSFALRVLRGFRRNQGLLLSGAVLWEITRCAVVWYYAVLADVNLIYGSIAAPVVALPTLQAAAVILLLGAQVIAELERKPDETN